MKLEIKKSLFILSILLLGVFVFFLTENVSSVGEATFCCERTASGAWCQDSPLSVCDDNYRSAPTSCESTSYCKLGTCVDSSEGTCLENTPQKVCQDNKGVWVEGEPEDISQCQLGCCLIGDQAAFVTQSRCEKLSADYGLDTNYRSDIQSEVKCIASATPKVKGACVIDDGFRRGCRLLTKAECLELEATSGSETMVEFHEGFLCSAENLATICGPDPDRTMCVENEDEVYFVDTCGNIANIYDSSKANNKEYWTEIKDKSESCNPYESNAGSASCGNCDYLLGSTCKAVERGNTATPQPRYGDFVCADLSCNYQGKNYKHGETWCGNSKGTDENLPGSEYYRLVCYNGEVTTEECSSFRQEVCIQSESNEGFRTAACRANRWQDCVVQDNKQDCENIDHRDCLWLEGKSILGDDEGRPLVVNEEGELVQQGEGEKFPIGGIGGLPFTVEKGAACVPLYAPGFDFWNEESEAEELCLVASEDCVVKFEKGLLDGWDCKENCECIEKSDVDPEDATVNKKWLEEKNNLCIALGDCGSSKNYIGIQGYHSGDAVEIKPVERD